MYAKVAKLFYMHVFQEEMKAIGLC